MTQNILSECDLKPGILSALRVKCMIKVHWWWTFALRVKWPDVECISGSSTIP